MDEDYGFMDEDYGFMDEEFARRMLKFLTSGIDTIPKSSDELKI